MINWRKQIADQGAHMAAAVALVIPILAWPSLLTAILAGLGGGLIREITEPDPVLGRGSILDMTFWAIGGGIAWLLWRWL